VAIVDSSWGERLGVALSGEVTSTPPYFGCWALVCATTSRRRTADAARSSGSGRSERGRIMTTSANAEI
jgi:hypothetical protein